MNKKEFKEYRISVVAEGKSTGTVFLTEAYAAIVCEILDRIGNESDEKYSGTVYLERVDEAEK